MALHRMRTINEIFKIVKAADPETALTPNCIRTLCKNGEVHSVHTGKKLLVDLDDFLRIIGAEDDQRPSTN